jgi:hypothetical protein
MTWMHRHYEALPWIVILIVVLLVLALLAWLGYPDWSDLREAA